jgi:YYY domain-containing protein
MILDWIISEGYLLPVWWLLVTSAGLTVFPLCVRLFRGLPDMGITLARSVGMLLIGFVFWLLASFGFVQNSVGGMLVAWVIVLVIALVAYVRLREDIDWRAYWRKHRWTILIGEIIFVVLFATLMTYRAFNPDTSTTEKPMELAFISGIMRSDTFPPNDPWLAGYSISYYHFGYIMTAMLAKLSNIGSGLAFSMMLSLLFALTGQNVFGVAVNLVQSRTARDDQAPQSKRSGASAALITGGLALAFVLLLGNLYTPLIEVPYNTRSLPTSYFNFWGVQDRTIDPAQQADFQQNDPLAITTPITHAQDWAFWWWFRPSRVLTDYDLNGQMASHPQPIDEFPAFSFVLGDVHPHVLALPFVVLAIGTALNIVLSARDPNRYQILFYGIIIGGLIFLNTWDGPIYLAALVGADALRRLLRRGALASDDWLRLIIFGGQLLFIAVIAYLPFLIGFRSQASGFVPNIVYPTHFRRFFLMFGWQLLILFPFLALETRRAVRQERFNTRLALIVPLGLVLGLLTLMLLLVGVGYVSPVARQTVERFIAPYGTWQQVLPLIIERRITYSLTALVLLVGIGMIVGRLFPPRRADTHDRSAPYSPATGFALLLVGIGFSLTLIPEFVYLRDNFGVRINTIFKFYYQAWIVFGIAAAFGVSAFFASDDAHRPTRWMPAGMSVLVVGVVLLTLPYLIFGFYTRGWVENGKRTQTDPVLTLDGTSQMPLTQDDYDAVMCLADLVEGDDAVVAEAELHAYRSHYARVGSITGIPIVLGWRGHQGQWRGPTYNATVGARPQDIQELYTDLRWDVARDIIERYDIDYIMFGATEQQQYGSAGEEKFREQLPIVCEYGTARVYRVTSHALLSRN